MNLLPQSFDKFGEKNYWDDFFLKRKKKSFEWYGDFNELQSYFNDFVSNSSKILNVGCGNSELSANMYDAGLKDIINIDFSEIVIEEMRQKNGRRKQMKYLVMDVLDLQFENEEFDVVVDKGGLDAIYSENKDEISEKVTVMLSEIHRVIKEGGCYICITLAQHFIIRKLLTHFSDCKISIFTVLLNGVSSVLNPFFVVIEKKSDTGIFLDWARDVEDMDVEKAITFIQGVQFENRIRKDINLDDDNLRIELVPEGETLPKYYLSVVNLEKIKGRKFNGKTGVFIVPRGREHEWMFSVREGQEQLAEGANYQRLVIAQMTRHYNYDNIKAVQDELSSKVLTLALDRNEKIPYLTTSDGLGDRLIIGSYISPISGTVEIEDLQIGELSYRRMIFLTNSDLIQSEVLLSEDTMTPLHNNVTFEHAKTMYSALILFKNIITSPLTISIIGLGGGTFPMFLHNLYTDITIESVELDPIVLAAAQEYFGLIEDERHSVVLGDGALYIEDLVEGNIQKDVIIIDVDSKDTTTGMSAPPAVFVEESSLQALSNALNENGIVLLNFSCRSTSLYEQTMEKLKKTFPTILVLPVEDSLNKIVVCFKTSTELLLKTTALNKVKNLFKKERIPCDLFELVKTWDLPDNSTTNDTQNRTRGNRSARGKAKRGGKGKRGKK